MTTDHKPVRKSSRKDIFLLLGGGVLIGAGLGLLLTLGLGIGGDLWYGLLNRLGGGQASLVPEQVSAAPDFTLKTPAGEPIRLKDLRGKPIVVNFWATWCGPCRVEMPLLQDYAKRYREQITVLAINDDEPVGDVQAYMQELGLTLTVLMDPDGKITQAYRVRGFPTTFFIDSEGQVRYQHIGQINEDQLAGYLQKMGVGE